MDNNKDFIENNNASENNETSKKKKIIIGSVVAAVVVIAVIVVAVMLTSNNSVSEGGVEGADGVSQSDVSETQESTTVKPGEYVIVDTESTTGGSSSNSNGSNQNNSSSGGQNGSQSGGNSGETSNDYNPDDSEDNDDDKDEVLVKRKITAYIELPNDGGASDTLEIYVNGELQKFGEESGVPVNINGKTVIFTTDKEYEGVVRIEAKLKKYGTSASQIAIKNGDTVSFALPLDSSEENFGQLD